MKSYTITTHADRQFDHDFNYISVIDSHYENDDAFLVLDVEVDESNADRYEQALDADSAVVSYQAN